MKGIEPPLHDQYLLWEDDNKIQIEATAKPGQRLCFYRSKDLVTFEPLSTKPPGLTRGLHGIIGVARLTIGSYILGIQDKAFVGMVGEYPVYRVEEILVLPWIADDSIPAKTVLESIESLKTFTCSKDFFFSYGFDITSSLEQRSTPAYQKIEGTFDRADDRFFWNKYLAADMIRLRLNRWIVPIIRGHFRSNLMIHERLCFDVILITRRSRHRAGTAKTSCGSDAQGVCANFCEIEQLVHASDNWFSHVQVRGHVPLIWIQSEGFMGRETVKVSPDKMSNTISITKHFNVLRAYYKTIMCLNLLDTSGSGSEEKKFNATYQGYVETLNWDCIKYFSSDLASESAQKFLEKIKFMLNTLSYFRQLPSGFTQSQGGIARTSDVEGLDRTQSLQILIAKHMIQMQMLELGHDLDKDNVFDREYKDLWTSTGEAIARQFKAHGLNKHSTTIDKALDIWTGQGELTVPQPERTVKTPEQGVLAIISDIRNEEFVNTWRILKWDSKKNSKEKIIALTKQAVHLFHIRGDTVVPSFHSILLEDIQSVIQGPWSDAELPRTTSQSGLGRPTSPRPDLKRFESNLISKVILKNSKAQYWSFPPGGGETFFYTVVSFLAKKDIKLTIQQAPVSRVARPVGSAPAPNEQLNKIRSVRATQAGAALAAVSKQIEAINNGTAPQIPLDEPLSPKDKNDALRGSASGSPSGGGFLSKSVSRREPQGSSTIQTTRSSRYARAPQSPEGEVKTPPPETRDQSSQELSEPFEPKSPPAVVVGLLNLAALAERSETKEDAGGVSLSQRPTSPLRPSSQPRQQRPLNCSAAKDKEKHKLRGSEPREQRGREEERSSPNEPPPQASLSRPTSPTPMRSRFRPEGEAPSSGRVGGPRNPPRPTANMTPPLPTPGSAPGSTPGSAPGSPLASSPLSADPTPPKRPELPSSPPPQRMSNFRSTHSSGNLNSSHVVSQSPPQQPGSSGDDRFLSPPSSPRNASSKTLASSGKGPSRPASSWNKDPTGS